MNELNWVAIAACLFVSTRLVWSIWRSGKIGSAWKRMLWSIVVLVPLFGWIVYGAFSEPLPKMEARRNGDDAGWAPHHRDL